MIIVKEDGGVWLNNDVVLRLQVDDSAEPILELRRLVEVAARRRDRIRGRCGLRVTADDGGPRGVCPATLSSLYPAEAASQPRSISTRDWVRSASSHIVTWRSRSLFSRLVLMP